MGMEGGVLKYDYRVNSGLISEGAINRERSIGWKWYTFYFMSNGENKNYLWEGNGYKMWGRCLYKMKWGV